MSTSLYETPRMGFCIAARICDRCHRGPTKCLYIGADDPHYSASLCFDLCWPQLIQCAREGTEMVDWAKRDGEDS